MRILSVKPGHDGHVAYVDDGKLVFCVEAEKDSGLRYAPVGVEVLLDALELVPAPPDLYALSGWAAGADPSGRPIGAGYLGLAPPTSRPFRPFGIESRLYSSSHERSHILCAAALSPFAAGTPCYALVWEGYIGAFYAVDDALNIVKLRDLILSPGNRYAFAYVLADPTFRLGPGQIRLGDAGKLMALAAFDDGALPRDADERAALDYIFAAPERPARLDKKALVGSPFFNCGVDSQRAKRLARLVSDRLLRHVLDAIEAEVVDRRPLLIGGGCGLNCDWNRAFLDSGLFSDIFIPPCVNDVGSAIGTAADVQHAVTGDPKLAWETYGGAAFRDDLSGRNEGPLGDYVNVGAEAGRTAAALANGAIIGWAAGRAEIGPRALGNRSILAAPFDVATHTRLNAVKKRENFRPIAPICIEADVGEHFDIDRPSPYMLYFSRVKTDRLKAVTHVDGSSRVQTVSQAQNPLLFDVLAAFRAQTGVGVLCNTSLNFNGRGFIDRASDLLAYASANGLDGFAVEGTLFLRTPAAFGVTIP